MKSKLLNDWTWTRLFYFLMGSFLVIQSITDRQWMGIVFGGYFASMGLFAFGCAAGQCYHIKNDVKEKSPSKTELGNIEYQE